MHRVFQQGEQRLLCFQPGLPLVLNFAPDRLDHLVQPSHELFFCVLPVPPLIRYFILQLVADSLSALQYSIVAALPLLAFNLQLISHLWKFHLQLALQTMDLLRPLLLTRRQLMMGVLESVFNELRELFLGLARR